MMRAKYFNKDGKTLNHTFCIISETCLLQYWKFTCKPST